MRLKNLLSILTLLFEECIRKYSQMKIFPEALPGEHIILLRIILLSMLHANSTKEIEISLGFASWNFELFCGVCVKFPQGVYTKILSFHWNDFRGFFVDCYELHLRAIFHQELTKFLFNHNLHLFGNSCFPQYLNTIVFLLNGQVFFRQFRQFYLKISQRHNIHGKLGNNNSTEITGLSPIYSSLSNKLYFHLLQMPIKDDPVFIIFNSKSPWSEYGWRVQIGFNLLKGEGFVVYICISCGMEGPLNSKLIKYCCWRRTKGALQWIRKRLPVKQNYVIFTWLGWLYFDAK